MEVNLFAEFRDIRHVFVTFLALIGTCLMRKKTLMWILRELNLLSFSWKQITFSLKLFSDYFYGPSFISTVRGSGLIQ